SILFRWFIGLSLDDPIWSPTTFSKNRDRLLQGDIASAFFDAVLDQARSADLMSDEHFTVDGTMLEAWASLKSFRRNDADPAPATRTTTSPRSWPRCASSKSPRMSHRRPTVPLTAGRRDMPAMRLANGSAS